MNVRVRYAHRALKDLERLEQSVAQKIVQKIDFFHKQDNPLHYAQKLKPPFDDLYHFRIGDYRAVFEVDKHGNLTLLTILNIRNRKDMYA